MIGHALAHHRAFVHFLERAGEGAHPAVEHLVQMPAIGDHGIEQQPVRENGKPAQQNGKGNGEPLHPKYKGDNHPRQHQQRRHAQGRAPAGNLAANILIILFGIQNAMPRFFLKSAGSKALKS